jgi:hypothetical protein
MFKFIEVWKLLCVRPVCLEGMVVPYWLSLLSFVYTLSTCCKMATRRSIHCSEYTLASYIYEMIYLRPVKLFSIKTEVSVKSVKENKLAITTRFPQIATMLVSAQPLQWSLRCILHLEYLSTSTRSTHKLPCRWIIFDIKIILIPLLNKFHPFYIPCRSAVSV